MSSLHSLFIRPGVIFAVDWAFKKPNDLIYHSVFPALKVWACLPPTCTTPKTISTQKVSTTCAVYSCLLTHGVQGPPLLAECYFDNEFTRLSAHPDSAGVDVVCKCFANRSALLSPTNTPPSKSAQQCSFCQFTTVVYCILTSLEDALSDNRWVNVKNTAALNKILKRQYKHQRSFTSDIYGASTHIQELVVYNR